ncbi:MAG TPA: DUF4352 domain-containing protein [Polyangiaceae bacterium]|nr:DUF4352 domain-containing protein [Polyangiaceae bacterium]
MTLTRPGAVLIGLAVLSACRSERHSSTDPPTTETPPASSEQLQLEPPTPLATTSPPFAELEAKYDDADFSVHVGELRACVPEAPFLPPPNHRRLAVELEVRAKTQRIVPVGPLGFSLEDGEGLRYGATLAGCGPSLPSARLSGSERAQGQVAFDVPSSANELRLVYEPFLVGRKRVTAFLALPSELAPTQK